MAILIVLFLGILLGLFVFIPRRSSYVRSSVPAGNSGRNPASRHYR